MLVRAATRRCPRVLGGTYWGRADVLFRFCSTERFWNDDEENEKRHERYDEWLEDEWKFDEKYDATLGPSPDETRALYIDQAWSIEKDVELFASENFDMADKILHEEAIGRRHIFNRSNTPRKDFSAENRRDSDSLFSKKSEESKKEDNVSYTTLEQTDPEKFRMLKAHYAQVKQFCNSINRLDRWDTLDDQKKLEDKEEYFQVPGIATTEDYLDPNIYEYHRPFYLDPDVPDKFELLPENAMDDPGIPPAIEAYNIAALRHAMDNIPNDPYAVSGLAEERIGELPKTLEVKIPKYTPNTDAEEQLEGFRVIHVKSFLRNKIVAQGRVETHGALIIGGNGKGVGGFGYGRGRSPVEAMEDAKKDLLKNLMYVPLSADRNLWGPLQARDKGSSIDIRTTIGKLDMKGPLMETLALNLIGIRGFNVKTLTNGNPMRRIRALFKALSEAPNPMEWAEMRGKAVLPPLFFSSRAHVEPKDLNRVIDPAVIVEGGFGRKQEADLILKNLDRLKRQKVKGQIRY